MYTQWYKKSWGIEIKIKWGGFINKKKEGELHGEGEKEREVEDIWKSSHGPTELWRSWRGCGAHYWCSRKYALTGNEAASCPPLPSRRFTITTLSQNNGRQQQCILSPKLPCWHIKTWSWCLSGHVPWHSHSVKASNNTYIKWGKKRSQRATEQLTFRSQTKQIPLNEIIQ